MKAVPVEAAVKNSGGCTPPYFSFVKRPPHPFLWRGKHVVENLSFIGKVKTYEERAYTPGVLEGLSCRIFPEFRIYGKHTHDIFS